MLDTKSDTVRDYLNYNREAYLIYWDMYKNLFKKVSSAKRKLYLTHGDVAKNLMIEKNNQMYIIDWDRIRLGPIELDLCEFIDKNTDINKLENTAKCAGLVWEFDVDYHNYFILNDLYYYLRNLCHSNSTTVNIDDYQQYLDSVRNKLIIK